jgi:hypothetical protein
MYDKALLGAQGLGADIERGPKAWLHPRAPLDGEAAIARGQMEACIRGAKSTVGVGFGFVHLNGKIVS